ncbi:MAG: V-type ATP synthase subunit D [Parcubacteria group bacterium]|nr:V-type ATP synthase subunit D [Parcubacteria group bacterium]
MAKKLNVNPTRMELLRLKKRVKTAKRGYKLLKEKRDGLMKQFMAIIREAKEMREQVEGKMPEALKSFLFASADMRPEALEESLAMPSQKVSLESEVKNVMSVNVPQFTFKQEGKFLCYSLSSTSSQLDDSLRTFSDSLQDMIKLAEIEHSAALLAEEIEKTRRRVNALEYVMIPDLETTVRFITLKLGEQERAGIAMVMRVKEMIKDN